MKSFTNSAILLIAALSPCSLAAVPVKFSKAPTPPHLKRGLVGRDPTILEQLGNNLTGQSYMAMVTVGTPPQDISLAIDTGSSDTWVLDSAADLCTSSQLQAEEQTGCETPYNSANSKTYKIAAKGAFSITYADGSGATGDYITDDFTIGSTSISSLEMGLAKSANLTQGLLGIGYTLNEASDSGSSSTAFTYPNIIDSMVAQKLINTNAYSLYLDDLDASSGSIIFGGMDTDKFHGNLIQLPIIPTTLQNGSKEYFEFGVTLKSFALNGTTLSSNSQTDAILDSGTSLTYLPTRLTTDIYNQLGAYEDTQGLQATGLTFVDCNILSQNSDATMDFGFGGSSGSNVTIKVPYNEMIITQAKLGVDLGGYVPSGVTFTNICILGISSSDSAPYILGDTFLRSAYVVYDLKNNLIGLAQTNFNSTTSNLVDFQASETSIPQASGAASGVSVTATETGPVGGATKTSNPTTTGAGSKSTSTSSSSTSTKTGNAGVATVPALGLSALMVVGGSLALAVLGGGLFLA